MTCVGNNLNQRWLNSFLDYVCSLRRVFVFARRLCPFSKEDFLSLLEGLFFLQILAIFLSALFSWKSCCFHYEYHVLMWCSTRSEQDLLFGRQLQPGMKFRWAWVPPEVAGCSLQHLEWLVTHVVSKQQVWMINQTVHIYWVQNFTHKTHDQCSCAKVLIRESYVSLGDICIKYLQNKVYNRC